MACRIDGGMVVVAVGATPDVSEESMNKLVKTLVAFGLSLGLGSALAAVPANTYLVMKSADLVTLDPTMTYDTASGEVVENLYETLVGYKGKSITELEGVLATKWVESNAGKTMTFTLRKGVKFHSGADFTCEDAEYTLRRNLVTNNHDSGNWFIGEALLGTGGNAEDEPNVVTWAAITKAVSCNKAGELVLNMPKIDPALLVKLAYAGQSIVDSKHAIKIGEWDGTEKTWKTWIGKDLNERALSKNPSGTGAYRFVKNDAQSFVAKAFDGYWGTKPKIENIILQNVKEQATRLEALKKNDADVVETGPRSVLPQFEGLSTVKIFDNIPNTSATVFMMNQNIKSKDLLGSTKLDGKGIPANFFGDINVRNAFAAAFDYGRYIKEVQSGKALLRTMALPESFFGYDKNVKPYEYNPEQAKGFFQKAFGGELWKNGFILKIRYRAGSTTSQAAVEILKASVEKLNPKFKIDIEPQQWSDLLADTRKGNTPMVLLGWAPDYADPDNFIHTFYHSEGFYAPRTNINDKQLDTLIDQTRATSDRAKRASLYSLIGQRARATTPFILLPAATGYLAYNSNLKGITENFNVMFSGSTGTYWKDLSK
jgi:peptide/nickel transport system substrate-binding protein